MKTRHEFLVEFLEEQKHIIESLQMPGLIERAIKITKEREFDDLLYFVNEMYTMRENFSNRILAHGFWWSSGEWFEYLDHRAKLMYGKHLLQEHQKKYAGMAERSKAEPL